MFESNVKYKNRYGDEYSFEKVSPTTYLFTMSGNSMEHCRMGGDVVESVLDITMFDPSGGPYITLGTKVDGKEIVKIVDTEDGFVVEVESEHSNWKFSEGA